MGTRVSGSEKIKDVLVLGGAGYLGSVLVSRLLKRGFNVRLLDSFLFGDESLLPFKVHPNCEIVRGDIRDRELVGSLMKLSGAVVHLAAIVGDSACEENKQLAIEVNQSATRPIVNLARQCGVRRFIFASSCSVYGQSDFVLTEDSPLTPLSLYAQMKVDSERIVLAAGARNFASTILRLGTLFGLSTRMRFDLVVNQLVVQAFSSGKIVIFNGRQWRPFLHVQDAAEAFIACLEADPNIVAGQVFNAGSEALNCRVEDLGRSITQLIPNTESSIREIKDDHRSYRVSFAKIDTALGFKCHKTLECGISETYKAIKPEWITDASKCQFNNQIELRGLVQAQRPEIRLWNQAHARAKMDGNVVKIGTPKEICVEVEPLR